MSHRSPSQPPVVSPIDWTYVCKSCKRGFNPDMAHQIVVRGPHMADIMCPWCKEISTYQPPKEIKRPPAIVGTSTVTRSGLTTARMFFEGGAWLQYRETEEGRVFLEVFNAEGDCKNSLKAEVESPNIDPTEIYDHPESYLSRAANQYEKLTVRGLKIHKPHVATVLVDIP